MNEANKFYKTVFTKIFNKMNEWQQIHQNTCDLYSILREDLDKAEYVDNENNFGVFQESDLFIKEVQNNFYSKIEKMLKLLNEQW